MKILMTGDWHLDMANLPYTVPAIEQGIEKAGAEYIDLFVHAGDLVVNRSNVHPHVAWTVRRLIEDACHRAKHGGIVVAGNHDQSFHADRVGMVEGVLAGMEKTSGRMVEIAAVPRTVTFPMTEDPDGPLVAFVCVPTPNKYWAKARMEEGADIGQLLTALTLGAIAGARDKFKVARVVVIYHGSISGATLADEREMPSGVDLSLPRSAFAGADIVLAGHIHHLQRLEATAAGPAVLYCGAPAPLTWNDQKTAPGMWLVDVRADDIEATVIHLDVVSQMVHIDIDVAPGEDGTAEIKEAIVARAGKGDRVRVRVRAIGAVLDTILPRDFDGLVADLGLQSLKWTSERTDTAAAPMEMSAGTSILEAVGRWSDAKGLDKATAERLLALARDVEARVTDRHIDARYEMNPRRLHIENWCQYEEANLDFDHLDGLTVVEGNNNTGKSNLLGAIPFALYKRTLRNRPLERLIRDGTERMVVSFDFASGGSEYRIIREVKRGSRGATAALHFLRLAGDVAEPIAEGNARETQDAIEKLVGPLDLFLATCFAGQNKVDSLLDLSPAELKDLLLQLLQRDFAARHDAARQMDTAARTEADRLKAQVSGLESAIVPVDPSALTELEGRLAGATAALAGASARVDAAADRVAAARAAADTAAQAASRAGQAAARVRDAEARVRALVGAHEAACAAGREADALVVPADPERPSGELEAAAADVLREVGRVEQERAEGRAIPAGKVDGARAAKEAADAEVARLAREVQHADSMVAHAMQDAELIDGVPCGGRVVEICGSPADPVDCSNCQFLQRAKRAEADYPILAEQARQQAGLLQAAKEESYRALGALQAAAGALAEFDGEMSKRTADLGTRLQAIQRDLAATRQLEGCIRETLGRVEKLRLVSTRAATIAADLEMARAQLAAAVAEREKAEDEAVVASSAEGDPQLALADLGIARSDRDAIQRDRESCIATIGQVESTMAQNLDLMARATAMRVLIAEYESNMNVLALYLDAMHRDGIPFLLLQQFSIPMLQAVANEYLRNTNLSVAVESEREIQSGETRNAVELSYSDHRGRFDINAGSGGVRTTIGSSLRHSIAELLARGTGSKIWMAVQDEGFGTLDPENLEIAKTALRNIAARRGRFFVISHVPGMSEVADHVLRVVDDGGTSRVEVR